MILWITLIIFLISGVWYHLGRTNDVGRSYYGKMGDFFYKLGSKALTLAVTSGTILALMLLCLVITHINFHNLVAERNAVQMTLDEYRESIDMRMMEKVGAIQQVFEINKEVAIAKYWYSSIWVGAFWPDGVAELDYIK